MTAADGPRRASALVLVAMALVAMASALAPTSFSAQAAPASAPAQLASTGPAVPASGALFGANTPIGRMGSTTRDASRVAWEDAVGRPAAVHRLYYQWDEVFPTDYEYELRDMGQTPILSWGVSTYEVAILPFADIAAGLQDATIDARAADIKAYGSPVHLIFDHEPDGAYGGTPAEFVGAWRRIHDRFAAAGVTNVSWVLTLTAAHYGNDPEVWYPGDAYVDLLAADGYNWYGCPGRNDPWKTFAAVFASFHAYGVAKGKPLMIAEWGSTEDLAVTGRKAQWIADAATTLKGWPEVKVVSWFDNGAPQGCDWWIDTSASSLAAFVTMANDPYFNPPPPLVTIDSAPADLSASAQASFAFRANRPASFTCAVDTQPAQACFSGFTVAGLSDGAHAMKITGIDGPSGMSSSVLHEWSVDTTAPVLTIDFAPPAYSRIASETVKLVTSEPDGGAFSCALDSAPMATCGVWVDYVDLTDGPHVISAKAYDAAGNPSPLVKVSWTVDTLAPTAKINTAPPALSNDATPTFAFSSTEPGSTFSCSKDLGAFISCTSPKTYTWMSNGAHTLDVQAKDSAGNPSATTRWSWTIDATKPTVSIAVPSNASTTSTPTFTITASESGTVLRCSLDAATPTVCGTTVSYSGIALGSHQLAVYATDAAGNVGKTVTISWRRLS